MLLAHIRLDRAFHLAYRDLELAWLPTEVHGNRLLIRTREGREVVGDRCDFEEREK